MLNIGLVIMLQMSIFFASDKKSILSTEDYEWLPEDLSLISENPQRQLITYMYRSINLKKLPLNHSTLLPKHINHAKNWLIHFNKKKQLDTQNQMECCRVLKNAAQSIRIFNGSKQILETFIFLKLLPYCFDVEKCKKANNATFAPLCQMMYESNTNSGIMNGFLYFYRPSLSCFDENGKPCLKLLINAGENLLFELFFKNLLSPIMYKLEADKITRKKYKDIHKNIDTIKTFLCSLKKIEKTYTIKIPSPILHIHILSYLPEVEFLKYCTQVEQEVGTQIEWIKTHDTEWYKNKISDIPFLQSAEYFKEWYSTLKTSNQDELDDEEDF